MPGSCCSNEGIYVLDNIKSGYEDIDFSDSDTSDDEDFDINKYTKGVESIATYYFNLKPGRCAGRMIYAIDYDKRFYNTNDSFCASYTLLSPDKYPDVCGFNDIDDSRERQLLNTAFTDRVILAHDNILKNIDHSAKHKFSIETYYTSFIYNLYLKEQIHNSNNAVLNNFSGLLLHVMPNFEGDAIRFLDDNLSG